MTLWSTLTSWIGSFRNDSLFVNSVTGLGGPSDPHATTQITQDPQTLTPVQLVNLYRNNGVASRVCRLWANDCTKKGWYIRDPSADPDPMRDEDRRLMIMSRVRTALLYSCIFGAGYLLIVTKDDVDENGIVRTTYDPSAPLLPSELGRIVNLLPMTTLECVASVYETDATSANFGRPRLWSCTPYPFMDNRNVITHHTRVLYFPGTTLPNRERSQNRGADQSILQAGYDTLKALATTDQSVGTYVQRLNRDVIRINGLYGIQSADQAQALKDRMSFMMQVRSMLGLMVLDSTDAIENQTAGISGFADLSDHIKDAVCAAYDTPRVVLFGESPGGLNADGDSQRGSWQSQIEGKQAYALLPALTYLYRLLYAQKDGPFQGKIPDHFDVVFNPLHSPTNDEQAVIRKTTAEMDKIYIDAGVYTPEAVRRGRFGDRGWQFDLPPLAHAAPNTGEAKEILSVSAKDIETIRQVMADVNAGTLTATQARTLIAIAVPDLPSDSVAALTAPTTPVPPAAIPGSAIQSTDSTRTIAALPFIAEYHAGEHRRGISPDGTPWESGPLPCDYGYLRGMEGLDGDDVDVLWLGPLAATVHIIEHRFSDGTLDEHKIVSGAATPGDALNAYNLTYGPAANYGRVIEVPVTDLILWLENALALDATPDAPNAHIDAAPQKYAHINFTPPAGVRTEARRGLEWRREYGRGGTPVGVARARDLSNGAEISPRTARRMASFFARHEVDKEGQGFTPGPGYPSAGRIAWALWGGDAGKSWAAKLVKQMEAADK